MKEDHADEVKNGEKDQEGQEEEEGEEEFIKRRGKMRRKRGRDSSRGPPAFQASLDPETQVYICFVLTTIFSLNLHIIYYIIVNRAF